MERGFERDIRKRLEWWDKLVANVENNVIIYRSEVICQVGKLIMRMIAALVAFALELSHGLAALK